MFATTDDLSLDIKLKKKLRVDGASSAPAQEKKKPMHMPRLQGLSRPRLLYVGQTYRLSSLVAGLFLLYLFCFPFY